MQMAAEILLQLDYPYQKLFTLNASAIYDYAWSHTVCLHSQTTEVSRRLTFTVCSCLILHHVVSFYQELAHAVHGLLTDSRQWQSPVATDMHGL